MNIYIYIVKQPADINICIYIVGFAGYLLYIYIYTYIDNYIYI